MNKSLQFETKKYIRQVKSLVFCNNKILKDFLKDFEFSNLRFQEDNDFMQRVLTANGEKELLYLSIPSYFYNYRRPGSNTHLAAKIDV